MVSLYLRLQLIHNNLLFLLSLDYFFLPLYRNIINIDISSLLILPSLSSLLPFTFTFNLLFLLRQLYLIHQFLLINLDLWIKIDDLDIWIIVLLIKYLPLVLFQSFLGVLVLLMQGSKTAVELFLSVLQLGVVYLFIDYFIWRKLLVFVYLPLIVPWNWPICGWSRVCWMSASLSCRCYGTLFLFLSLGVSIIIKLFVRWGPFVDFVKVLQLVFEDGDASEFAEHFE